MNRFNCLIKLLLILPCIFAVPLLHHNEESIGDFDGFDGDLFDLGIGNDYLHDDHYEDYLNPKNEYVFGTLDSYYCDQNHYHCANDGICQDKNLPGETPFKICHCPTKYLGPKCEQSRNDVAIAVRGSPQFKESFEDCMESNSSSSEMSSQHVFSHCIGSHEQNCWLRKGGKQALNCFFWVSDNALQLGVVEQNEREKPRMEIYEEVFRKMIGKIFDETKYSQPEAPSPIYSMQVSVYGSQQQNKPPSYQPQGRYQPLRINIEAPTFGSEYNMQLEDRNMVPGEEYSDPPDSYLSHITDPYQTVPEHGTEQSQYQNEYFGPYGGNSESVLMDESEMKHDETPSKKTIVQ